MDYQRWELDLFDILCEYGLGYRYPAIPSYHPSGPGDSDYGSSMQSLTPFSSGDSNLLSNDPQNNPQLRHVDSISPVPAIAVSDFEVPSPNLHRGYPEGSGVTSSPSQSRHPVGGGDPQPSEGSSAYIQTSPIHVQSNRLHFPSSQTPPDPNLNTNISREHIPIQYDHTFTHPGNNFVDPSTSTVAYGLLPDKRYPLDTGPIYSTSSCQNPAITRSTTSSPNLGLASHRRRCHHIAAMSSSQVSAPRPRKEHWCECGAGFTQKQVLQRHRKTVHGTRLLCPYCGDFKWSPSRKYALKNHFEEKHPGVALPECLQRKRRIGRRTQGQYHSH